MIPVPRTIGEPAGLVRPGRDQLNEAGRVLAKVEAVFAAADVDTATASIEEITAALQDFSYSFSAYGHDDVKVGLHLLFHGKCAYCETRYASSQPMDVEHYRPKGRVRNHPDADPISPGYYWLASAWDNLLPSCIDCNRRRNQAEDMMSGKADLFPLAEASARQRWHGTDEDGPPATEEPLLLNPCVDEDIDTHLQFHVDGTVTGLTDRGRTTIDVLGLMRPGLVIDRRQVARVIEFRAELLAQLHQVRAAASDTSDGAVQFGRLIEELIILVKKELRTMASDDQPYAGMVRQLLRDALEG